MIFLFYIDIKKKISLRCFLTINSFFKMFSKKKKNNQTTLNPLLI